MNMKKKDYIRPTSHVITLAGENMLFTPSIPINNNGTGTGGSDAESKQFFMDEEWDMDEEWVMDEGTY